MQPTRTGFPAMHGRSQELFRKGCPALAGPASQLFGDLGKGLILTCCPGHREPTLGLFNLLFCGLSRRTWPRHQEFCVATVIGVCCFSFNSSHIHLMPKGREQWRNCHSLHTSNFTVFLLGTLHKYCYVIFTANKQEKVVSINSSFKGTNRLKMFFFFLETA